MKKKLSRGIGVFIVMIILTTSAFVLAFSPKRNLKPSEYNVGIIYDAAMREKKPFVAMFFDDGCSFCHWFAPKFKVLSEIYAGKYNFVMINLGDSATEEIVREYAIGSLPTIYIIDPSIDNRVLISNVLYGNLKRVRVELERYLRIRAMINK